MDEALKLVTDASLVESEWMLKTAATEVDRILQYHFVSPRFASFRLVSQQWQCSRSWIQSTRFAAQEVDIILATVARPSCEEGW